MQKNYVYINYILFLLIITSFTSCKDGLLSENHVAYFGGEIENPKNNFVVFMKNDKVVDTFYLDKKFVNVALCSSVL